MEKLKMHTPNMTDANMEKLAELFPNCITEAKDDAGNPKLVIDFDALKQQLSENIVEGTQERYQLNWVGKKEALLTANAAVAKTLRPDKEQSVNFEDTKNIYIEGDNLDALKILQETYLGKVKVIYVDPPYNTGRDILYANNFQSTFADYLIKSNQVSDLGEFIIANTESNGRFHSDWLSMMYSRILLSRNLLTDDGVFIIAIDHYELSTLISLCNEVFGEDNRLGIVTVVHKPEGRNQAKFFGTSNEFAIFYAKNKDNCNFNEVALDSDKLEEFDEADENGKFRLKNFIRMSDGKYSLRENKPDFYYPIYVSPNLEKLSIAPKENYTEIYPITSNGQERTWKTTKETCKDRIENGTLICQMENNKPVVYEKLRESQVIKTHWIDKKYHAYHFGTKVVDGLLNAKTFDFPKSLPLIFDTLKLVSSKDDIILDFFSGSGTTAHATIALNAEDGGNRKFIMVQLPEECDPKSDAYKAGFKKISDIGKERIRRAGKKVKEENPNAASLDIGFRVLKVDTSNMADVFYNPDAISQDLLTEQVENIKPDRTSEDLLFQVLLDWGVDLTLPISRETIADKEVFFVAEDALAACFDTNITEDCLKAIALKKPLRVVFRDSGFSSDSVKINVEQIFKLISPSTDIKTI